ncbi:hypothetical protein Q8F55_006317 [Vanrija albida]|uniref:Protein CPL1-like domain-containing protein n=1 Tax=Vanrija albida TaxID=181172 RepID=A0ABR3PWR0_9TREE
MASVSVLLSTIAALVLLAPAVLAQTSLQTYAGCIWYGYLAGGGYWASGFFATPALCAAECAKVATNNNFVWGQANQWCGCGPYWQAGNGLINAAANDGGVACGTAQGYQSYMMGSTFVFGGCTSTVTFDSRDIAAGNNKGLLDPKACYAACKSWRNVYMQATTAAVNYNCYCANFPPATIGAVSQTCSSSTFYLYQHTALEASQGLARRQQRLMQIDAERVLAENPYCPPGRESCRLSADPSDESFECLYPQSELESCGGCRYGRFGPPNVNMTTTVGVDCTALPGVRLGAVTCSEGQCVISGCRKGFRLQDGACVPSQQKRGLRI